MVGQPMGYGRKIVRKCEKNSFYQEIVCFLGTRCCATKASLALIGIQHARNRIRLILRNIMYSVHQNQHWLLFYIHTT